MLRLILPPLFLLHGGLIDNARVNVIFGTVSLVADVDPYGLIFKVLHVLNLHISYGVDIWDILGDV